MRARIQKLSSPFTSPACMSRGMRNETTPVLVNAKVVSTKPHSFSPGFMRAPLGVVLPSTRHFLPSKYSHDSTRSSDAFGSAEIAGSDSWISTRTSASGDENSSRDERYQ